MGNSRFFGSKAPVKPHLIRGSGGLQGEIADLRRDIDESFVDLEATQISGSGRNSRHETPASPVSIPAGGGATIDGPAEGYIRIITSVQFSPTDVAKTAILTVTHQTSGLLLSRAFSVPVGTGAFSINTALYIPLAFGDSLVFTNTAAATNDATLFYSYIDVPAAGYTVVAEGLVDTTLVEIIPAAPEGYFSKLAFFGAGTAVSSVGGPRGACIGVNDDTATAIVETYLGTDYLTRFSYTTQNVSALGLGIFGNLCVTTKPVNVKLRAAVTTPGRSYNIIACYETLPIAA